MLGVLACFACGDDDVSPADAGSGDATSDALLDAGDPVPTPPVVGEVPETARLSLPGLSGPAHVVFTESHVPHVYAATEEDAARVLGYLGLRAFSRLLRPEESAALLAIYRATFAETQSRREALRDAIAGLLVSPP
ncbi:MAG: DUF1595 domain-containing protein, partial [Myxococcales bacterium]|nr:DUF1595 domain-containing protein [Myxococcales bacterium]